MLLLVASRQIFASGDNTDQKLGMNLSVNPVLTFRESGYDFNNVDLGASHGLGISKDGDLYCWGRNAEYQCTN